MADRSEEARRRAEANFKKKEQQAQEADKVWAERAVAEKATEQNAARLKALRLARDVAETTSTSRGKRKRTKNPETPGLTAPSMEVLVHDSKEREVLPTHRQAPTKVARAARKKVRPST
jgi:hypothetical protein